MSVAKNKAETLSSLQPFKQTRECHQETQKNCRQFGQYLQIVFILSAYIVEFQQQKVLIKCFENSMKFKNFQDM